MPLHQLFVFALAQLLEWSEASLADICFRFDVAEAVGAIPLIKWDHDMKPVHTSLFLCANYFPMKGRAWAWAAWAAVSEFQKTIS